MQKPRPTRLPASKVNANPNRPALAAGEASRRLPPPVPQQIATALPTHTVPLPPPLPGTARNVAGTWGLWKRSVISAAWLATMFAAGLWAGGALDGHTTNDS